MLSAKIDTKATKRFFIKASKSLHNKRPRAVTIDKNRVYPNTINQLKNNVDLNNNTEFRGIKYLNNIVEQDHRFIKKIIKSGLTFKFFNTSRKTLKGIEASHMMKKGQVDGINQYALAEN